MLGLNLKIIVDVVPMSWAAMILPKNSLLTAMFREDILWLHERGIMQDLMLKWKGGVIGTIPTMTLKKVFWSVGQTAPVYFVMTLV